MSNQAQIDADAQLAAQLQAQMNSGRQGQQLQQGQGLPPQNVQQQQQQPSSPVTPQSPLSSPQAPQPQARTFFPVARSQWMPDAASNKCLSCGSGFGLLTRRHHCRACGRLFCGNCCANSMQLDDGSVGICCVDCISAHRARALAGGGPRAPQQQMMNPYAPPQQQQQMMYGQPQQQMMYQQQGGMQMGPYYGQQATAGMMMYAPPAQQQGGYPPQQQPYAPPQQQFAPPPQQQQQPGMPPPQQQQQPGMPPPPVPQGGAVPSSGATSLQPGDIDAAVQAFAYNNEIKPMYIESLKRLAAYDTVLVCDDSGSMSQPAAMDNPMVSRWAELKMSVNLVLQATAAFGKTVDVYFLNRGVYRGISSFDQLAAAFSRPPGGGTNTIRTLNQIWADRQIGNGAQQRPLIVHLFTDGHPTNDFGNEDIQGLARWLQMRPGLNQTFFALLLCTDDEEVVQAYRPFEYRVQGQWGWRGRTCGIPGVDVTEDYRGELRDIRMIRGFNFRFSQGDYIVKCLVGCIDPAVHAVDLPAGYSIYVR